jgi:hypothetical protein
MKRLLLVLAVVIAGCGTVNGPILRVNDSVSCDAEAGDNTDILDIQDFKYAVSEARDAVNCSFVIVNKTSFLMTYDGFIITRSRGFGQTLPISGVLSANEKKTVAKKIVLSQKTNDVSVRVRCAGTQVVQQ